MGAGLLLIPFALFILVSLIGLAAGSFGVGLIGLAGAWAWLIGVLIFAAR